MSHLDEEEVASIVANLKKVDPGLGLDPDEKRWAVQQAFKHKAHLAFSKKELGLCTKIVFDMKLKDPN